jgi:hypothetical protein
VLEQHVVQRPGELKQGRRRERRGAQQDRAGTDAGQDTGILPQRGNHTSHGSGWRRLT